MTRYSEPQIVAILGQAEGGEGAMSGQVRKNRERKRRGDSYSDMVHAQRLTDAANRWARLAEDHTSYWLGILKRAMPLASLQPAPHACCYDPWRSALSRIGADAVDLMIFAAEAGHSPWPPDHGHLVEFALAFLEADPMLFRSGYAKRHLARRLLQVALTSEDRARIGGIMQRAVLQGTGLEEFRPYCRLAQKAQPDGLMPWLAEVPIRHADERVRRNARYMLQADVPWWQMHRLSELRAGIGPP